MMMVQLTCNTAALVVMLLTDLTPRCLHVGVVTYRKVIMLVSG